MSETATTAPAKPPPALMLITSENIKASAAAAAPVAEDIESMLSNPPFVQTTEIVLVDPSVLKILNCLPYKIPKHIESSILGILQASWAAMADGDKAKMLSIFKLIGGDRQVSTRLRTIVNEITKDGRIDMDDLPHITELIITLTDIFQDLKLPSKSDHLLTVVFEFLVMIIVASTLPNPDELERWSAIIRSAMKLVELQVRKVSCKWCC